MAANQGEAQMRTTHDGVPNELAGGDGASAACGAPGESTEVAPQLVAAALAQLGDAELRSLCVQTHELLQVAPDFVWWIGRLANGETNRRAGLESSWPPDPEPALSSNQDARMVEGALSMRRRIAQQSPRNAHAHALASFFDAIVGATGDRRNLHQTQVRAAA